MDLELSDDQLDLQGAARAVLADACPPELVRAVVEGSDPSGDDRDAAALWATLVALDWPALALPPDVGGLGLGFVETAIVVEELGRVVAPTPYLATVTHAVPLLREAGTDLLLADIARGAVTATAAVAEGGRWDLDALGVSAHRRGDRWVLDGTKTHVLDGATATEVVVVARAAEGLGVFVVPGAATRARPQAAIDPTLPLASVALDGVVVEGGRVAVAPGDPDAARVVTRALEEATAALALSTVATCRAIFERTVAYAIEREQFGRPIGSFQAVKHRLADCYLAVERAGSLAYVAALTIAEDDERRAVAVAMAKSAAGECQRLLVRDGLQLHGGIGFTWEHDLHLWLKRAAVGDLLLGTEATHRARLAHLLGLAPVAAGAGTGHPEGSAVRA